jgi:reductive dehalogenase
MIENSKPLSFEHDAAAVAVVPREKANFVVPYSDASGQTALREISSRHVDQPALGNTAEGFERFSGDDMFTLYPRLKAAHDGEGALEKANVANSTRASRWIRESRPGFDLRDRQLSAAAGGTLMYGVRPGQGLLSWTRLAVPTPAELGVPAYSASPSEAASTVKDAARLYGAALAGIAPMNELFVNRHVDGKAVVFEEVEVPEVTNERLVIPRRMRWVVVLAIPVNVDLLARAPSAVADAGCGLTHSQLAFTVSTLSEFIRGLGYQAIPSVNETAQFVPFAMDAGLGELGRMNKLVTPEFGSAVRLCTVFTDLPMACDKPIEFGLVDRCRHCKACAKACPAGALSFEDEPSFQVRGPWNNAGHEAWFEDSYRCFEYWQASGTACAVCVTVCPFTKGEPARMTRVIRAGDECIVSSTGRAPDRPWWVEDLPSDNPSADGRDETQALGRDLPRGLSAALPK